MSGRGLLVVAIVGAGLVAGVFFAFSTFVMPALARLPAGQGAAAMQSINVAAINRWLMTALFGSGLLALALSAASLGAPGRPGGGWVLLGTAVYLLGVIAVTIFANVPRNEALALLNGDAAAAYWPRYLTEWSAWNHVRAVASVLATACFVLARG
jgi:uncharacterized membrane protein